MRFTYFRRTRCMLALSLAALFVISGCSDDDNPAGNNPQDQHHLHAVGVRLIHDSDTLVTADGTNVTGEIEIHEGDTLGPCLVWFLDPDSGWYHPAEHADHHLQIDVTASNIVQAILGETITGADPWSCSFIGLEHGETTVRVKILHVDHPDYTSPLLPVHVHEKHANAAGLALISGTDTLVIVNGSQVTGSLTIPIGASGALIHVWFMDPDSEWFQPGVHHGEPSLGVAVADTLLLTVLVGDEIAGNNDPWIFQAAGSAVGATTIQITIVHEDHADYTSPQIPVTITG